MPRSWLNVTEEDSRRSTTISETSRRFAGLIAVLVLAAGITAASAQDAGAAGGTASAPTSSSRTKWFAPGFPHMVGVVGGDIVGQFGGAVLDNASDATGRFVRLTYLHRPCPDPRARSPSASRALRNTPTNTAVLDGRVVDRSLKGACTCRIRGAQQLRGSH